MSNTNINNVLNKLSPTQMSSAVSTLLSKMTGGANVGAITSLGLEAQCEVLSKFCSDRLTHCMDSANLTTTWLSGLAVDGISTEELTSLCDNNFITDSQGVIIQFERLPSAIRVWRGDDYDDIDIVSSEGLWKISDAAMSSKFEDLADVTDDIATDASETLSYITSLLASVVNTAEDNMSAILSNGLSSKNESVRALASELSILPTSEIGSTLVSKVLTNITYGSSIIGESYTQDQDAGVIDVAQYSAEQTVNMLQGGWTIVSGAASAVGSMLLAFGGPVLKICGAVLTGAGAVISWISQKASDTEYCTFGSGRNAEFANAAVLAFDDPAIEPSATYDITSSVRLPHATIMRGGHGNYNAQGKTYAHPVNGLIYPLVTLPSAMSNEEARSMINDIINDPNDATQYNYFYNGGVKCRYDRTNDVLAILPFGYYDNTDDDEARYLVNTSAIHGYVRSRQPHVLLSSDTAAADDAARGSVATSIAAFAFSTAVHISNQVIASRLNVITPEDAAHFNDFSYTESTLEGVINNIPSSAVSGVYESQAFARFKSQSGLSDTNARKFLKLGFYYFFHGYGVEHNSSNNYFDGIEWINLNQILSEDVAFSASPLTELEHGSASCMVALIATYVAILDGLLSSLSVITYGSNYTRADNRGYFTTALFLSPDSLLSGQVNPDNPNRMKWSWVKSSDVAHVERSSIISDPACKPAKFARGTVLATVIAAAVVTAAVTVTAVICVSKFRKRQKIKMMKKEQEAIQAFDRLKEIDPSSQEYQQAASDYIKKQRKFQKYANRIGYSSNNVGSYNSSSPMSWVPKSDVSANSPAGDLSLTDIAALITGRR